MARSHQIFMHVYEALYCEVRPVRSWPKNATKQFISLIIDVVDGPKSMGRHPVISLDLEKALSAIQKGTEVKAGGPQKQEEAGQTRGVIHGDSAKVNKAH